MRSDRHNELNVITTDALEIGEVREYNSFDEAYAALYSTLEPGGSIDLHDEDCALAQDGPECTCVPHRMVKGTQA
jgi:hypothetical protein